ncbi:AF4 FMR2, member [Homalodisca vitripennis]|nr:AF4 FMR2, member [Homalodisca vitripennis]
MIYVNPSHNDKVSQQVRGTLGEYESVKHLLEEPGRLLGYDGVPPPSPAPVMPPSPRLHQPAPAPAPTPSPQEFKKPKTAGHSQQHSNHHHNHTNAQRGGFVKPADGKPAYGGRGFYPGQPVKHGSTGGGSGDHRTNGLVPSKGPPASNPFRTIHQHPPRPLPRLNVDNSGQSLARAPGGSIGGGSAVEVEKILKVCS